MGRDKASITPKVPTNGGNTSIGNRTQSHESYQTKPDKHSATLAPKASTVDTKGNQYAQPKGPTETETLKANQNQEFPARISK